MSYHVRISGTVLSSLLYDCANSENDAEGFFLGALSVKTTMVNDDNADQGFEKREEYLLIHGYQLVREKPYNAEGALSKSKMLDALPSEQLLPSVVGYFKFRRQTETELSLRDQLWMRSYASNIPYGCMAIITANVNADTDNSTQTYEFAFWDMKSCLVNDAALGIEGVSSSTGMMKRLPLHISNMNESTLGYKQFMSNVAAGPLLSESVNYNNVSPHKSDPLATISSEVIIGQYNALYEQSIDALKASADRVKQKELELQALREDVEKLKCRTSA